MKKITNCLILFILLVGSVGYAQPMYFNTNAAAGNNNFPFNTTTSRKCQWCIMPNTMGTISPGNNITVVYLQAGSTSSKTFPLFNIKLKQTTSTSVGLSGGGLFETGMTTV